MNLETKKASTTNFDVQGNSSALFSETEEKSRRAKAHEIAVRAQKRQNEKIAGHIRKGGKSKRHVSSVSRSSERRSKAQHKDQTMVTDSDF